MLRGQGNPEVYQKPSEMRTFTRRSTTLPGAGLELLPENRVPHPPGLLVSVRSAAESLVALEGGASIIDIKEPANGSLGRASRAVQVAVVSALRDRRERASDLGHEVTVTAALGELVASGPPSSYTPVPGLALYKLGLSGCRAERGWTKRLDAWRQHLATAAAELAAVAYADHGAARAPEPRDVLDYAIVRRLPFLLVVTYEKTSGSLRALFGERELTALLEEAHRHGVSVALAGSLRLEDLPSLARLGADVLAVRGAACRHGNRELDLDAARIRELARLIR